MKTIGIIGGMSWESTCLYYQRINQAVNLALGGLSSAKILLNSVNFAEIEAYQSQGEWLKAEKLLIQAATSLQQGGADFIIIATNTMHKVAPAIEASIRIPLLHIAAATGEALKRDNITRVGLLGTRFTMQEDFYKGYIQHKYAIDVMVPDKKAQSMVNKVIYTELCHGNIVPSSKQAYLDVLYQLFNQGAQAVILGCTEIGLLIEQADTPIKLYDTTAIHAEAAVAFALQ
ncbi:aspartate/glutamate racemase family protein [Aliikangiella sp. IMCC44632]